MATTSFEQAIVGQRQARALLERALDGERVNHAYLFVGPAGVGKSTLAHAFARALNCQGEHRPCGSCRPCRLAARNLYPEMIVVEPGKSLPSATNTRSEGSTQKLSETTLVIEQVRQIQRDAVLSPREGRWKVYLIPEASLLTTEAANCLLKTLEEPAPHVVLILTAEQPGALLPTIVSRCQTVRLAPLPIGEIEAALIERYQVPAEQARTLARLSGGRPGWAIGALSSPETLTEREARLGDLETLARGSRAERLSYSEKLALEVGRDPEKASRTLKLWLGWWRDVLLVRVGCEDLVANWDYVADLRRWAGRLSVEQIRAAARSTEATMTQLAQNVNTRLALDVLLLDMPAG